MKMRSTLAKGAIAAIAGAMALGGAASVSAQPYGGQTYYEPCQRDTNNRTIGGALLGGAGGAVLGSQFAASGHRRDGSLLGGVVGAIAGGMVGNKSAACEPGRTYPNPQAAYAPPQGYAPAPQAYYEPRGGYERGSLGYTGGRGYYGARADYDGYAYGGRGERFRVVDRPVSADGCTLAESPIYLPDGRVQKRFVRVCMDSSGRYQVVD